MLKRSYEDSVAEEGILLYDFWKRPRGLHLAVERNDESTVRALLFRERNLMDLDAEDSCGSTALHVAARCGHGGIARMLLEAGANAGLQDPLGATPLHVALNFERKNVAELLLDRDCIGLDGDQQDEDGRTPLHWAVLRGYTEIARKLLAGGANTRIQDKRGRTPLHVAVERRAGRLVDVLLDKDPQNNRRDFDGETPLHYAVLDGCTRIVRKLLTAGANTRMQDERGRTALHVALYSKQEKIAELLSNSDYANDLQDEDGNTPMHWAAMRGYSQILSELLTSCVDLDFKKNRFGLTALDVALMHKEQLLADVILALAVKSESVEAVKDILFCNGHPHVKGSDGKYPLEIALRNRCTEMVAEILKMCTLRDIAIDWTDIGVEYDSVRHFTKLVSEYQAEIQQMRVTIVHKNVSYLDVARQRLSKIALLLENDYVRDVLLNKFVSFPFYDDLIAYKVEMANERRILLDPCKQCFAILSKWLPPLPVKVIDIIVGYLSAQGMSDFLKAIECKS